MADQSRTRKAYSIISKSTQPFVYILPACTAIALVFKLLNYEVVNDQAKVILLAAYCILGILFTLSYYFNRIRAYELIAGAAVLITACFTGVEVTIAAVAYNIGIIPAFYLSNNKTISIAGKALGHVLGIVAVLILSVIFEFNALGTAYHSSHEESPDKTHTLKITKEYLSGEYRLKTLTLYDNDLWILAKRVRYVDFASSGYKITEPEIYWMDNNNIQIQWHNGEDNKLMSRRFNILSKDRIRFD